MDTGLKKNLNKLEEIKDIFSLFTDPLDMIAQLIDIGKTAHNLNNNQKIDENIINGCTSKAWLVIYRTSDKLYTIKTDSDSHIVSGLLYLLSLSINNQTKDDINKVDAISILKAVGLEGYITSQRTNGFISAVETLKHKIN